jgi:two-component system, sensor histidine kinase and response regulator
MSYPDVTKVLIIDDSEEHRYIFRRYLRLYALQYDVYEAPDGKSGSRLAETLNPDCILLDLNLPGESGHQVLVNLVGPERPPKRTVIIVTGVGGEDVEDRVRAEGAAGILVKGNTDAAALDLAIQQAIKKDSRQRYP